MTTSGDGTGGFEALARQYFNAWGDALRHAVNPQGGKGAPENGAPSWQQAIDWWTQLLPPDEGKTRDDVVHRFREQAGSWYGTMQEVAARFAGRDASSADVASAWREAVNAKGDAMLHWMLDAARGGARTGVDWSPFMGGAAGDPDILSNPWLHVPGFGPSREHQARWQALLKAQQEYQARSQAYVQQVRTALDDAFVLFEQRLGQHEDPGSQLTSARALFDLWIEVAEEAYARVAMSEQFQQVYAELGNAQMRLKAGMQREVERQSEMLGLPTRTEMDAAHRRIAELERQVRRLMQASTGDRPAAAPAAAPGVNPRSNAPAKAARRASKAAPARTANKVATKAGGKGASKTATKTAAKRTSTRAAPKSGKSR